VLIGVIVFIAVLVFMAIVYYLVRVRPHPDETTHEA
jgi:Na+/serine symporter